MVLKTGKGGIATGNTIRALGNRHSRRYAAQPMMTKHVERSDVAWITEELDEGVVLPRKQRGIWVSVDDGMAIKAEEPSVVYSLNKKGRWALPALLKNSIEKDCPEDYDVTIVERHKLSSSANAVGVHSTRLETEVHRLGNSTYFHEKSVFAQKSRTDRSQPACHRGPSRKSRQPSVGDLAMELDRPIAPRKPEVVYDVYYPSPSNGQVAHHAKYTRNEKLTGLSGKATLRGKQRHLNQDPIWSQMGDFMDAEDDFEDELLRWNLDDSDQEYLGSGVSEQHMSNSIARDDYSYLDGERCADTNDITVWTLRAQAATRKALSQEKRMSRKRKVKCSSEQCQYRYEVNQAYEEGKPWRHLVEADVIGDHDEYRQRNVAVPPTEMRDPLDIPRPVVTPAHVNIAKDDLRPDCLRDTFKDKFRCANILPSRYTIDICSFVRDVRLNSVGQPQKNAQPRCGDHDTFLLIEPSVRGNDQTTYVTCRLTLLGNLRGPQIPFTAFPETMTHSMADVIQKAATFVNELPLWRFCPPSEGTSRNSGMYRSHPKTFDLVQSSLQYQVLCVESSDMTPITTENIEVESKQWTPDDIDLVCAICCRSVGLYGDDFPQAACLLPCQHWFCSECWLLHLTTEIRKLASDIYCPEYGCDCKANETTILAAVGLQLHKRRRRMMSDNAVAVSSGAMFCPNAKCGRVLMASSWQEGDITGLNARCICGKPYCITCHKEAHWPLPCDRLDTYIEQLMGNGDYELEEDVNWWTVFHVSVKTCPHCSRPMQRRSGCNYMVCLCGRAFCWHCRAPWGLHHMCKTISKSQRVVMRDVVARDVVVRDGVVDRKRPLPGITEPYIRAVVYRNMRSLAQVKRLTLKALSLSRNFKKLPSDSRREDLGQMPLGDTSSGPDDVRVAADTVGITDMQRRCLIALENRSSAKKLVMEAIDILLQMCHVAEYATVMTEASQYHDLRPAVCKLQYQTDRLHEVLITDHDVKNTSEIPDKVVTYVKNARKLMRSLANAVRLVNRKLTESFDNV